jgi:ribosomal protein S18 acetylase RimI-like enzyme
VEGAFEIVRLRDDQLGEATAMLGRAFHDDPAWSWIVPDPQRRASLLPWLFRMGFEILEAEAWTTTGAVIGAARWLPPGPPKMRVGAMLRAAVATPVRAREATSRFFAYGRAVEALRVSAAPWPHWYLAGIGVEPAEQRRGIGAALLAPGIEAAQAAGVPCALVTNTEANLSFYGRHGFEVVRETQTPDGGPRAWALVRRSDARRYVSAKRAASSEPPVASPAL